MSGFVVPPDIEIFHTKSQRRIWDKFWRNVNKGNYNVLTEEESLVIRDIHSERLKAHYKQYSVDGTLALPIRLQDGTPFLSGYRRIVVGDHGAYIEFEEKDLLLPIQTKKGQEWRENENYECKYHWKQPVTNDTPRNVKIYFQTKRVKYADYLTSMYYVDPYEVTDSVGRNTDKDLL